MPTDVLIVNIAVLFAVLEADLGRRKITRFRILRPLLLAAGSFRSSSPTRPPPATARFSRSPWPVSAPSMALWRRPV
jgi:hypothetical protein